MIILPVNPSLPLGFDRGRIEMVEQSSLFEPRHPQPQGTSQAKDSQRRNHIQQR